MKFTEATLQTFAAPLSDTEDQKCKNAIGMVRDALKLLGFTDDNRPLSRMTNDSFAYMLEMRNDAKKRRVKIFIQGSYANNTCVRMESDVDIAIVQEETFQTRYRSGITDVHYGFRNAPQISKSFKDEIQECLKSKFGNDVERKNKSIKVHGNTYRKDADTVPCMRLRNYLDDYEIKESNYKAGIFIKADDGEQIINYPEQHIENGRKKNVDTAHAYKRMVRIIKKMRSLMEDSGYSSAKKVSSFGLESLLWNINNSNYTECPTVLWYTFSKVVNFLKNDFGNYDNYKEVNGIKPLFPDETAKLVYKQFVADLRSFYEYEV